ncbi:MAG: tetratricopeptide repeat protein [candidate division Zixibacteria bacterium]|nr:tetratricopeptide repeat protein [candidate division Zixibacteria bacterium]
MSSKLHDQEREYLIQTTNDGQLGSVLTTIYVNGRQTEVMVNPHPVEVNAEEVLSLVRVTHGEKKKEIELLLQGYHKAKNTGDSGMMYHLGTAFFYKGLYAEAVEMLSSVVILQPSHHQALNYLGIALRLSGRTEESVQAASAAVQQCPAFADYRNNLGESFLLAGSIQAALREFKEATQINLYYSDAYFNLGITYLTLLISGTNPEAELSQGSMRTKVTDAIYKASLIYPQFKSSAFDDGMRLLEHEDWKLALNQFKRVREAKKEAHRQEFSTFHMRFILHPDFVSEKAISDRIDFLQAEISKNPNYVDLMAELAQCYEEQAKLIWQKAIVHYTKCLQISPTMTGIVSSLRDAESVLNAMNKPSTAPAERRS